jgi:hypothetical protein
MVKAVSVTLDRHVLLVLILLELLGDTNQLLMSDSGSNLVKKTINFSG